MEVLKTDVFDKWLKKLRDKKAKAIIQVHINRIIENTIGQTRSIGQNIHEKKINYGPGYRLYFVNQNKQTIILLCGGDKSTQQNDIEQAQRLALEIKKKGKQKHENI